jgi:hypothetical protein
MKRTRTIVAVAVAALGASAVTVTSPTHAATKTTKSAKSAKPKSVEKTVSGTGERLKPDNTGLPADVLLRRAAKARGARPIVGSLTFAGNDATPAEKFTFNGTVDFSRRQGDVSFGINGVTERYLFVDDAGFLKVSADRVEELGGSWVRSAFADEPLPSALVLMEISFATPEVLSSVKTWKDRSTAADKAKKVRRLTGMGLSSALPNFKTEKFQENVPVEAIIETDGILKAVTWNLKPLADEVAVSAVAFLHTYGTAKPFVVTAPVDGVVEYADAAAASAEAASASDPSA